MHTQVVFVPTERSLYNFYAQQMHRLFKNAVHYAEQYPETEHGQRRQVIQRAKENFEQWIEDTKLDQQTFDLSQAVTVDGNYYFKLAVTKAMRSLYDTATTFPENGPLFIYYARMIVELKNKLYQVCTKPNEQYKMKYICLHA